jgi:hypothetical protein
MTTTNLLRQHLISDEAGASSFLATLLDARNAVYKPIRRKLADLLDLPIPEKVEPSIVRREHLDMDLVVEWGDWLVIIENKVCAASVTRGQLDRYYKGADKLRNTGPDATPTRRICMVYLTPTLTTGKAEFDSLTVSEVDAKKHIAWPTLCDAIRPFNKETNGDLAEGLIALGIEAIASLIADRKTAMLVEDEVRMALRAVLMEMRSSLKDLYPDLTFSRWSSAEAEQLFVTGPRKRAYITLYLPYRTSTVENDRLRISEFRLAFEMAAKQRKAISDTEFGVLAESFKQSLMGHGDGFETLTKERRIFMQYNDLAAQSQDYARELTELFSAAIKMLRSQT